MGTRKRRNPFYILLIPVGVAFVVTAFAYGLMAFSAVNGPGDADSAFRTHPLFRWLRTSGDAAMLWELAALAVLTVATIATDSLWSGRVRGDVRPATGQKIDRT
ncbi:MAG TPA: hypothetical protein VEQ85_03850 [Lacipirellulaceae bacterium]|nr:hypothetical protein [Lacipirellulaceae bacterium]